MFVYFCLAPTHDGRNGQIGQNIQHFVTTNNFKQQQKLMSSASNSSTTLFTVATIPLFFKKIGFERSKYNYYFLFLRLKFKYFFSTTISYHHYFHKFSTLRYCYSKFLFGLRGQY